MNLTLKKKPAKVKPLPPKYHLNLAGYDKKPINPVKFAISLIIVVLVVVAFAKFLVIDRLAELDRVTAEAAEMRRQIDANYEKIKEMEGLTDEYAHYTFSGMTEDELALVSRLDVMEMIRRNVLPNASLNTWTLQGNTLTLSVTDTTLAKVNQMVAALEAEPITNYSFVQTAATDNSRELLPGSDVSAQITVYLQIPVASGEVKG